MEQKAQPGGGPPPDVTRRVRRKALLSILLTLITLALMRILSLPPGIGHTKLTFSFCLAAMGACLISSIILMLQAWREQRGTGRPIRILVGCGCLTTGLISSLIILPILMLALVVLGDWGVEKSANFNPANYQGPLGAISLPIAGEGQIEVLGQQNLVGKINQGIAVLPPDHYHLSWFCVHLHDPQGQAWHLQGNLNHPKLTVNAGTTTSLPLKMPLKPQVDLVHATIERIHLEFRILDGNHHPVMLFNESNRVNPLFKILDASGRVIWGRHLSNQRWWELYTFSEEIPKPLRPHMRDAARIRILYDTGPFNLQIPEIPWPAQH